MAAYDGTIRIDSRIDTKGFNAGIKGLQAALGPLARAVAATFAVAAIVAFGRTAVQEASALASAMVGLESITEGVGVSFTDAHDFIKDFTSDGLVPATNAINSYKNLLLRGYDTSQIEMVLTALKDSAAFGRQGSLSMGEAIQNATEGLKNENSILVDNAGVTKNVAMMWRDYAASIGTTVGTLTKQQKILAEVAGIMEETRFQTGDGAKLAGTYAGQVSALGVSFYNLRVAIGNIIIPIAQRVLPFIKAAIDALTVFANKVAMIFSILFGVDIGAARQSMEDQAAATNAAADAQGNLAKQTEKAGKAAKGALAPFDELNVLQQPEAASGAGAGVGTDLPIGGGLGAIASEGGLVDEELEKMRAIVEEWKQTFLHAIQPVSDAFGRLLTALEPVKTFVGQALIDFYNNFLVPVGGWVLGEGLPRFIDAIANGLANVNWENINDSLNNLWDSLAPFAINIGEGLLWLWENVLVPFGTWVLNDVVPVFLDLLSAALDSLNDVIEGLKPAALWLWENVLKPAGEFIGDALINWLKDLTEKFKESHKWIEEHQSAWKILITILAAVGIAILLLTSPIALVVAAIIAVIAIIANWGKIWEWLKGVGKNVLDALKAAWATLSAWFKATVVDPIAKGFTTFLDNLKTSWERTFGGIKDFVKNTVNTIIDFINGMIRAVAGGINAVIGNLNSVKVTIPDWVPLVGGKNWALNIPTVSTPQIPRLAKGAVIPPNAEFLAMLGDQKSGRNIEAPEGLIRQIIQDELSGLAEQKVTIEFGNDAWGKLIRELHPRITQETIRKGSSLITGAVS